MRKPKHFYVYIMANNQRFHVLYKLAPGFTSRYNLTRLVYCEMFCYPGDAIQREKEIKGWVRSKKVKLIESTNPHWHDLAAEWENLYAPVDRTPAQHARSFAALRPFRTTSSDKADGSVLAPH
jgi:putative endonuclease